MPPWGHTKSSSGSTVVGVTDGVVEYVVGAVVLRLVLVGYVVGVSVVGSVVYGSSVVVVVCGSGRQLLRSGQTYLLSSSKSRQKRMLMFEFSSNAKCNCLKEFVFLNSSINTASFFNRKVY